MAAFVDSAELAQDFDPEGLLTSLLITITEALDLEEVGDPYMTLRGGVQRGLSTTQPTNEAGSASWERIGAVRIWQPPSLNRAHTNCVEKLVYLHLQTEVVAAQWIFAFTAASSLVPHFGAYAACLPRHAAHTRQATRARARPSLLACSRLIPERPLAGGRVCAAAQCSD